MPIEDVLNSLFSYEEEIRVVIFLLMLWAKRPLNEFALAYGTEEER